VNNILWTEEVKMSTYQERQDRRTMGNWFFLWAMLLAVFALAAFVTGNSAQAHHIRVNPWIGYGFAVGFIPLSMFCMLMSAINHNRARY